MKYDIYLRILDQIVSEAPNSYARYHNTNGDIEKINQARSRASVHLFMKVLFGLLEFEDREKLITDGAYDGGIDGYYIDSFTKVIYLIQAKFRATEKNYENKQITFEEILNMDINRILEGEQKDEAGNAYNGKIRQLQREISELQDIGRYSYKIVLLANLINMNQTKLRQLTGGYAVEVFNYEKSYDSLVFPVITGTYYTASDISIPIDLSNKNAGSKISYTVTTKISTCEITVLFIPTIELAKIMDKYKNSVLKYNPRSYLDMEGKKVNSAIRETILNIDTNEFALYNNGITMLSDETYINEKIGQKNRAQLIIKNPQIINGGQTSYTLSRIYNENKHNNLEKIFGDKEVLLKIITLLDGSSQEAKLELIDAISDATNQQTPVINADRFANEALHKAIQKKVFDKYGLLYERKRGEYSDGIMNKYVDNRIIVERNQFFRIYYASNGRINLGSQKKLFQKNDFPHFDLDDEKSFDRFYLGFNVFKKIILTRDPNKRFEKDIYAKIYAYNQLFESKSNIDNSELDKNITHLESKWHEFLQFAELNLHSGKASFIDKKTGETKIIFKEKRFYRSKEFEKSVISFFG